jgi:REP element-mobilizing transposase RayT
MARQVRIQYPGAIYHVMARGDRREDIFYSAGDRSAFLKAVGEMCVRSDVRVHAYVLMDNHYHLVIETPQGNLVEAMRWLQNTYTRRFNLAHDLWGHLFGGRYKAVIVDAKGGYFRQVIDYVHLNPVRAGQVKLEDGIESFEWSSLNDFVQPLSRRPKWLTGKRVFKSNNLHDDAKGRRAYLKSLELQVREHEPTQAGLIRPTEPGMSLQATVRRGWFFGSEQFKEALLRKLDEGKAGTSIPKSADGYHGIQGQARSQAIAKRITSEGCRQLGVHLDEMRAERANRSEKMMMAEIIASNTTQRLDWIREHLGMGSRSHCSRLIGLQRKRLVDSKSLQSLRNRILARAISND